MQRARQKMAANLLIHIPGLEICKITLVSVYLSIWKQENSPIYFITSNLRKFASLQKLLQPLGVDLAELDCDFDEGRRLDICTIAKVNYLKPQLPDKRLVVDDRGFFIPVERSSFRGRLLNCYRNSFSYPSGIIKLMKARLIVELFFLLFAVGLTVKDHFRSQRRGSYVDEPSGDSLHGWTVIFMDIRAFPVVVCRTESWFEDRQWISEILRKLMGSRCWGII